MSETLFCVYEHISPSNKKYVGISCDPIKRWSNGEGYKNNWYFYKAIQKYGWQNFEHIILADGLTAENAKRMERELIENEHLTNHEYGYNLREGGDGSFSEESRNKMSQSRIGNTNCVGFKHSEEFKEKVSNGLKEYYKNHVSKTLGKTFPQMSGKNNVNAKSVVLLDWDLNIVTIYPTASEAASKNNCSVSSVVDCCKGRAYCVKHCLFRYYDEKNSEVIPQEKIDGYEHVWREIEQYSKDGTLIAKHKNASTAARVLNVKTCNIVKACEKQYQQCCGFIWRYSNEE